MPPRARPNYGGGLPTSADARYMAPLTFEAREVLEIACKWRRMQDFAGHVELNTQLAMLGQAIDRYSRTQ